jgi:hypothetical protein
MRREIEGVKRGCPLRARGTLREGSRQNIGRYDEAERYLPRSPARAIGDKRKAARASRAGRFSYSHL